MQEIILTHILPQLIDLVLPAIALFALTIFRRYTGVQIEGKHMLTLQSALGNAGKLMLGGASLAEAIDYVMKAAPDALAAFGISTRERIEELLKPHLVKLGVTLP